MIKTNHESLQFLVQQKLHIHLQRKRVSKLMGLDFTIQYKMGKENVVVGALSKRDENAIYQSIVAIVPEWMTELADSYGKTEWLKEILAQLVVNPTAIPKYTLANGLMR